MGNKKVVVLSAKEVLALLKKWEISAVEKCYVSGKNGSQLRSDLEENGSLVKIADLRQKSVRVFNTAIKKGPNKAHFHVSALTP